MLRLLRLSSRELLRALDRLGFVQLRQQGSHVVLQRGPTTCVVPQRKEIKIGTPSGILDQAELTVEYLLAALG